MKYIRTHNRERRHARVRAKITGTASVPRVSVFRSNRYMVVQFIDDAAGRTLVSMSDAVISKDKQDAKATKTQRANKLGVQLAELATKQGIAKVVFDRGGYAYHGRVRALAEGLRSGNLIF